MLRTVKNAIKCALLGAAVYVACWHAAFGVVVIVPAVSSGFHVSDVWGTYTISIYALWSPTRAELMVATQSLAFILTGVVLVGLLLLWLYRQHRVRRREAAGL
jgi:hypothetical protein